MRRRDFIAALGALPLAAQAQRPAKMKRIAYVHSAGNVSAMTVSGPSWNRAFFGELIRLGYVEGQNLSVDRYSGEGRTERYLDLARDIVNTRPDLIVVVGGLLSLRFKMATSTIPVVVLVIDPIGLGLVTSIARPGGNITGLSISGGLEIIGKRMELLAEAIPKLSTVRYLASLTFWEDARGAAAREAAKKARIALSPAMLGTTFTETEYRRVFSEMERDRTDALMVSEEPEHAAAYLALIVELAAKIRIPTMYPLREFVESGGLISYSTDLPYTYRRLAALADTIFKGANPADTPFDQPTKFELTVNLRTAKALGLEMPATVLAQADDVIE